jgi:OHCU decarboxylase
VTGGLERLNALPAEEARLELLTCCGSSDWAKLVATHRPFPDEEALLETADRVWRELRESDWLEAFRAHPRIGGRKAEAGQTAREQGWSAGEQAGMDTAAEELRAEMARLNAEYEARFGHIYIVCAAGRSADELLAILRRRLANDPATELRAAAEEQRRITRLRLRKLLHPEET